MRGIFRKGKSVGEDWSAARVQPLQQSAIAQPAATLHSSEAISSISSEMTVVGKIICKGVLKIYGLVEGELNASNALITDGARIQGDIVAEELTIGGRVKGNIDALRVKLQGTAVVEGDIIHRSLAIEENAWFVGRSRPEHPEPPSKVENSNQQPRPQALVAFDDKGEFNPRGSGMRVYLAACIAIIVISVVGYFALRAIDPSWIWRSAESHYTALRPTTPEAPQEAPVAQMAPEMVAPKAPAAPSLDPEQVQDFRINDVSSARKADVTRLTSNAIEFSDHTTAGGIDSETALMPFGAWASSHPTEKKFLALFPGYVEPVIGSNAADGTDKATEKPYTEKLYMYVAQARFVLAKAPAATDLSRYVTLPFLEKIDPAIKHKLISAADVTAFKDKAGTGNDNPDRRWCTGPATSICIQSTYKLEGKIPMGITLVNKLRDSKKVVDHIDFQSELAVLGPSDLDQVGLQELTGLDTPVTGALEQNIFYVNQIMKFGKFFAVLQTHPDDAGKTVVTAFMALAIKASILDEKRSFEKVPVLSNLVPAQVLMGQSSFNFGSSISAGLPKYARNEIKTVATLLQAQ